MLREEQKGKRTTLIMYRDDKESLHAQMLENERSIRVAEKLVEQETKSYTSRLHNLSISHMTNRLKFKESL